MQMYQKLIWASQKLDLGENTPQDIRFAHSLFESVGAQIVFTSESKQYNNIVNDSRVEHESWALHTAVSQNNLCALHSSAHSYRAISVCWWCGWIIICLNWLQGERAVCWAS